jgi:hypothetical protein
MNVLGDDARPMASLNYGMKILGAFVGSDDFIRQRLITYMDKIELVMTNLMNVTSIQHRNILFRTCFCPKVLHILRTTRPDLSTYVVARFNRFKKRIFCSMIDIEVEELKENTWKQFELNISDGGMGVKNLEDIRLSAFMASFTSFYKNESNRELLHLYDFIMGSGLYNDLRSNYITQFCDCYQEFSNIDAVKFPPELSMDGSLLVTKEPLQAFLTGVLYDRRRQNFLDSLENPDDKFLLAWIISLTDPDAARWMTVSPKSDMFRFTDVVYKILLRFRFYLIQPIIREGSRCTCKSASYLDLLGHHLVSGCGSGGFRTRLHDAVAQEWVAIIKYCGYHTLWEEVQCFSECEMDYHTGRRPDISVLNPDKVKGQVRENGFGKLIMDVQLTNPIPGSLKGIPSQGLTINNAKKKARAANASFDDKVRKYGDISARNSLEFLPIIFETTGSMEERARDYVKSIAYKASKDKKIKEDILYAYMMNRISCTLQRNLANSIICRANTINGGSHSERSHTVSYGFVRDHENVFAGGDWRV